MEDYVTELVHTRRIEHKPGVVLPTKQNRNCEGKVIQLPNRFIFVLYASVFVCVCYARAHAECWMHNTVETLACPYVRMCVMYLISLWWMVVVWWPHSPPTNTRINTPGARALSLNEKCCHAMLLFGVLCVCIFSCLSVLYENTQSHIYFRKRLARARMSCVC